MDAAALRELLRPAQEALGYFFNADAAATRELLEGLLANKARYGYMSCPCRLAAGERERDRDFLCPCVYRAPDVAAYGSCYCGLYVSPAWNAGEILRTAASRSAAPRRRTVRRPRRRRALPPMASPKNARAGRCGPAASRVRRTTRPICHALR